MNAPFKPDDFIQARNFTPADRSNVDVVIVHTMESPEKVKTAWNVATWFAGKDAPKASAHYCVDADHVIQCVLEKDVAWHAPGANRWGIGIEHAGYAKQTPEEWADPYSEAMLLRSAELAADIAKRYELPIVRLTPAELKAGARGFAGHVDCSEAFEGGKGHWDPGPHFPWDRYLAMIEAFYYAGDTEPEIVAPPPDAPPDEECPP